MDDPKLQFCHTFPNPLNSTTFDFCLKIQSFFTWEELDGLNICFMWMLGSAVLFIGILVLIETGVIKRILSGSSSKVKRFHL